MNFRDDIRLLLLHDNANFGILQLEKHPLAISRDIVNLLLNPFTCLAAIDFQALILLIMGFSSNALLSTCTRFWGDQHTFKKHTSMLAVCLVFFFVELG